MASLTRKKIGNQAYWYARECAWVNGKPKIVATTYLGKADDILRRMTVPATDREPDEIELAKFGAVAACFSMAQDMHLKQIIDRQAPKRSQGLSVGTYLEMAVINRVVSPTSKNSFADWYGETILRRLMPADKRLLTSQRFWDHMGYLDETALYAIEAEVADHLVKRFNLPLRNLIYDATNFFTYINTRTAGELAQRGHNKQKRNDLRQVSLALMVTEEFHIPLFHVLYGGNVADATEFRAVLDELVARHEAIGRQCERVTLVFDKGNNSEQAIDRLEESHLHFVGSLVPAQHQDLLEAPRHDYLPLSGARFAGVTAYRTQKTIFGQVRTVVVTFNEELFDGQVQGLGWQLQKKRRELRELQQRLEQRARGVVTKGRKPTIASITRQVEQVLSWQYHKELFEVEVAERDGHVRLTFSTKVEAIARLQSRLFGKTILFTDNDDWQTEQIVAAYRGQYRIEDAFKQMKHPVFVSWNPRLHWTTQKVRVHAFYCVMALAVASLLQRQLHQQGLDISIPEMLEELSKITEVALIYPKAAATATRVAFKLSKMNEVGQKMYELLDLKRFLA
jgi:transposase